MSTDKSPIRNGLRDISMDDFWKNALIVSETLERKLQGLPVDRTKHPVLASQILDALHLLRAIALRRYGAISMLAVQDVLAAVDYFIVLRDAHQDSLDNGYEDDADRLRSAFERHKNEIDEFRLWFSRHERF
ncbi:MAG TPA: hypothetical protein VGK40_08205 [Verrucomicrobiae bacterium]|jgi:hypothetical protein